MATLQICRGSTEHWYSPLQMAQKVLQRMGGSKGLSRLSWNGKWLMQNYVYHELTVRACQVSHLRCWSELQLTKLLFAGAVEPASA